MGWGSFPWEDRSGIRPCWKTLLYLHTLAGEKLIGGSVLPFFQVMCDQRESEVHRAWQHMLHKKEMFTNSYLQHSVSPLPVRVEMVKRYWVSASQWSRAPQLLMPNVSLWRSTDNQWDRKTCPPLKPHDCTALSICFGARAMDWPWITLHWYQRSWTEPDLIFDVVYREV